MHWMNILVGQVNFTCDSARPWCPAVWSKANVGVAVSYLSVGLASTPIDFKESRLPFLTWAGLTQSAEAFRAKLKFPD